MSLLVRECVPVCYGWLRVRCVWWRGWHVCVDVCVPACVWCGVDVAADDDDAAVVVAAVVAAVIDVGVVVVAVGTLW